MSRTYRRKGFDKWSYDSKQKSRLIEMCGSIEVYEFKRFQYNHLDNHANTFSASLEYRKHRMKQNRIQNKLELWKYNMNFEYEPMCYREPKSCGRDRR